jgi:hypothetical protein
MTLNVARGVNGLTIVARFNSTTPTTDAQGQEVRIVHEGTIHHIILSKKAMEDLLAKPPIDPNTQKLGFGASTLVHELVHMVAYREGCYDPLADDDEPFAHAMEDLINDKVHITQRKKQGQNTDAEERALTCRLADLFEKEPKGRRCMQLFGFTVPEGMLLQVSAAGLVFTAEQGQPAQPPTRTVTVSALDPQSGGAAQICFTRKIRRKNHIIAEVTPGGKKATSQELTVSVTTTDESGNPRPPGVYEDFVDISSPSAISPQTVIVRLKITGPGVKLDHTLNDKFTAGKVICLGRITGGKVSYPDLCPSAHLHATAPQGITIDGEGPFPDSNPTSCGYGVIVQCP